MLVQVRSSRQTSTPLPSGRTRSRITASGGWSAAAASGLLGRRGGDDLVAGAAQGRLERPQDLRLVVDDEDRARSRRVPSPASLRAGRASANDAPCPATRLGPDAAAVRLREAAGDRETEPGAPRALATDAVERLEDPLELLLGQAGAVCRRRGRATSRRVAVTRTLHGRSGRRELERVLDQVDEHALDLDRVDPDDRDLVRERHLDPLRLRRPGRAPARRAGRRPRAPASEAPLRPGAARDRAGWRRAARAGRDSSAIVSSSCSRSAVVERQLRVAQRARRTSRSRSAASGGRATPRGGARS